MRAVGCELAARLTEAVQRLDLDNRQTPLDRAHEEEEDLARMLLAAAWYQVFTRSRFGFTYTPLFLAAREDPGAFTLTRLLELPAPDMVADVLAQLYEAAEGPLEELRSRTVPRDCIGGPTFAGVELSADADLVVDGLLLDFKSTRRPSCLDKRTVWQLVGYLLLDTPDRYRIDTLSGLLAVNPAHGGTRTTWLRRGLSLPVPAFGPTVLGPGFQIAARPDTAAGLATGDRPVFPGAVVSGRVRRSVERWRT